MKINEIACQPKQYTAKELLEKFANFDGDDFNTEQAYDYDDTRRPRLTIRRLQKLRKASDARKAEIADHKRFVHLMYGEKDELATQQAIDAKQKQLDREVELEKERIKQKGELEKEKLKIKADFKKEQLKQAADIEKEKRKRQADREEEIARALYMDNLKEQATKILDYG